MAKSKLLQHTCLAALSLAAIGSASFAALSNDDVITAVTNQKILAPGSRMSVKIDNEHLIISTYRQTKETDKTNKVQAVLIAKAVTDIAPNITRVSVYFFDSTSLSKYKQVDVTAGDVKAYTGDQLTLDQLLSSVEIKDGQIADEAGKISNYLDSRKPEYPVTATFNKDNTELVLNTKIEGWTSALDCKYRALKLAYESLDAGSSTVKLVRVDFGDPADSSSIREVSFEPNSIKALIDKLDNTLGPVAMVARKADLTITTVAEGVLKSQRTELLNRINKLAAGGAGVAPFLAAFKRIEDIVGAGDEAKVDAEIKHLSEALDTQEQRAKDAKNKPVTKTTISIAAAPVQMAPRVKRWVLGIEPILDPRVLRDPDGYIQELQTKVDTRALRAEDNPKFYAALAYFAQTLRANNRVDDAAKFEQRLAAIKARHANFTY